MKMTRNLLSIAMVASLLPSAANATRWVFFAKADGRSYFVDADAVVLDRFVATIWLKTVLAKPGKKGEAFAVEKWMHDCKNDRAKLLALTIYKVDGRVMGSGGLPHYRQDWQASNASKGISIVHQEVCDGFQSSGDNGNSSVAQDETA